MIESASGGGCSRPASSRTGWLKGLVCNLVLLVVAGTVAERILGRGRWMLVYFGRGIAGQVLTNTFDATLGAGNSAANSMADLGLVGAVAATVLCAGRRHGIPALRPPGPTGVAAVLVLGLAVCLAALPGQHGPVMLLGAVLGVLLPPPGRQGPGRWPDFGKRERRRRTRSRA